MYTFDTGIILQFSHFRTQLPKISMNLVDPLFWTALLKIIGINIVLSGDNAVVIALAARSLPADQQKKAIFWGSAAAIIMRIILTIFAVKLLQFPWLKIVGAGLLFWIGVKLLIPEDEDDAGAPVHDNLLAAIKTILIADLVMSLDNVIGVAAAAKDDIVLLVLGLGISIPLIIFASTVLLKLMERFPVIITIGAGLLGFVAGEMLVTDPVTKDWVIQNAHWLDYVVPAAGALFVVGLGKFLAGKVPAAQAG
jgi:YjbE family integral membrane protein